MKAPIAGVGPVAKHESAETARLRDECERLRRELDQDRARVTAYLGQIGHESAGSVPEYVKQRDPIAYLIASHMKVSAALKQLREEYASRTRGGEPPKTS